MSLTWKGNNSNLCIAFSENGQTNGYQGCEISSSVPLHPPSFCIFFRCNEHNWYLKHLSDCIVWSFSHSWWLDISSQTEEIATKNHIAISYLSHILIPSVSTTPSKICIFVSWESMELSGLNSFIVLKNWITTWLARSATFWPHWKGCGTEQLLSYLCRKSACLAFDHHSPVMILPCKTRSL